MCSFNYLYRKTRAPVGFFSILSDAEKLISHVKKPNGVELNPKGNPLVFSTLCDERFKFEGGNEEFNYENSYLSDLDTNEESLDAASEEDEIHLSPDGTWWKMCENKKKVQDTPNKMS
ncbi:hypothetical protein TNIN_304161 [Trichonephila inaurata madagascariensis]|uniref:Uncharacterized protein n=1 Tax=Trichonephila inaurata madagascariensis TaxID=2747483 RepID=A0A8X7CUE7_9ARAC|nr:hypothetical protein TNIN_442261 [Trichonephila inaurata madagascariensis]GFY78247.1 hypothetical protein TNIN_304161 [Trichonephila inaurata madagascariensis]